MSLLYLESPSVDPAFNLALEQYVFDHFPQEHEYCMLWQNDKALIFGKHQNTAEEINASYVAENNIQVVRRLSGGGAVYHDLGNINFTFVMHATAMDTLDLHRFCLPVVRALKTWGVETIVGGRNDITIDGQKFSGNAQYLKKGRVMHHGTILFDSDLSVIRAALDVPQDSIRSGSVKSTRSPVGNVRPHLKEGTTLRQFWDVLCEYMLEGQECERITLTKEDTDHVIALANAKYRTWEWNYGSSPKYSIQKKRRIADCGRIQVCMDVERGKIKAFATYGDYFGTGDSSDITTALIGCQLEESALHQALEALNINDYYNNLTRDELIKIILQ